MKKLTPNLLRASSGILCLLGCLTAQRGQAGILYYDNNGLAAPTSSTWDLTTPAWSPASGGVASGSLLAFTNGALPVFNAYSGPATVTLTVNTTDLVVNGLYNNGIAGFSGYMTFVGSGNFVFPAGGNTIWTTAGRTTYVKIPINGPGQLQNGGGGGSLYLYATNGYTGGTLITTGAGININNSYVFGTGSIAWNSGISPIIADPDATFPLNITNSVVATAGTSFIATGAQPITWSGPWSLPTGTLTIQNGNGSYPSFQQTFSGPMSGSGSISIIGTGTLTLSGANTFTGSTTVNSRTNATILSGKLAGDAVVSSGSLKVTSSGFIGGNVTISGALSALELDSANSLTNKTTVSVDLSTVTNGAVALNFSGTQSVLALKLGGVLQSSGTYGGPGSSATYQFSCFSGNGVLSVPASPVIVAEPQSVGVYPQTASRSFTVAVTGDQTTMQYQWKYNGTSLNDSATVSGSQTTTLTLYPPFTAGTYTCAINNVAGSTNTLPATLSILATNDYVNAVLQDVPVGYWRLDETNGSTAYDWVGGHHAAYINANINQPGFSVVPGSDPAISVPKNTAQRGYVGYTNAAPDFSFQGNPFTLEAWASSTNFGSNQRIISTAANAGGGYALSFPDNKTLQFTINFVADWPVTVPTMSAGTWYHCVVTFDGNTYTLYLNGTAVGTHDTSNGFVAGATQGLLCFGNDDPSFPVSEQVKGGLDEVAIYNVALTPDRVSAHYVARYSDAPLSVSTPTAAPATNYVSLSSTLSEAASGAGLTYQWYHGSGTGSPVGSSSTSSTLTRGPLQLSDAGSYHCVVTDAGNHSQDTPMVYLAVVPIPTNAAALNLTNGLVLHLPFDSDYKDISGRNNNGTAVGATSFAANAAIGGGALHYGFQNGVATNYVTLGTPADLKFGASGSFTVSYWVRGTANTGLPFLCDSTNGLPGLIAYNGGFYFGPDTTGSGGWQVGIGSAAHEMTTSGASIINDGNWHNLVHVVNRAGNVTTYLDGNQVDAHPVSFVTDSIDSSWPVNIGQDGTGAFAPAADQSGDVDDVAVWNRTLSQFEVDGVYLTGVTYKQSFAPIVVTAPPLTATTISSITPTALSYTGGSGTHFVLQGTTNLVAPITWTRLLTNSATPGSFTLPVSGSSSMFYRVSSEN